MTIILRAEPNAHVYPSKPRENLDKNDTRNRWSGCKNVLFVHTFCRGAHGSK